MILRMPDGCRARVRVNWAGVVVTAGVLLGAVFGPLWRAAHWLLQKVLPR